MSFDATNRKCFARPPKFKNRMIMMLCGIMAQGLGLSILRAINLGTDPCSCLTQGVTNFVPLSFGTCQLLCDISQIFFNGFGLCCCRLDFLRSQSTAICC